MIRILCQKFIIVQSYYQKEGALQALKRSQSLHRYLKELASRATVPGHPPLLLSVTLLDMCVSSLSTPLLLPSHTVRVIFAQGPCFSSLYRSNLLCIAPILADEPSSEGSNILTFQSLIKGLYCKVLLSAGLDFFK